MFRLVIYVIQPSVSWIQDTAGSMEMAEKLGLVRKFKTSELYKGNNISSLVPTILVFL